MRKTAVGIGLALCCMCCSGALYADDLVTGNSTTLNSRIQSLQARIKEFHARDTTALSEEEKMVEDEECVELILDRAGDSILPQPEKPIEGSVAEQIVEELENRTDVAMTVLFHDTDLDKEVAVNSDYGNIEPPRLIFEDNAMAAASDVDKVFDPKTDKELFYNELRKKVFSATRNGKSEATEVRQQMASLN